jgi:hypothetical protein
MHGTRKFGVVILGLLLAAGATFALHAQSSTTHPDFTGAWKLNPEKTDRPAEQSMEGSNGTGHRRPVGGVQPGGMGGGGGHRPGGMGGGGGYGGGSGRMDPEEMAKIREALRLAMLMPERLTIVRNDAGFLLTDGDGVSHTLTPDGKSTKSESGAIKVETKAKWEDATLVVERKFDGGVKATDRYSMTESPRQLFISTKIESSRMPSSRARELQRVYDLIPTTSSSSN